MLIIISQQNKTTLTLDYKPTSTSSTLNAAVKTGNNNIHDTWFSQSVFYCFGTAVKW